jgi:hypothetical protein
MANITRSNPFDDFFKDGVLILTLPKKSNGSAKRITVS